MIDAFLKDIKKNKKQEKKQRRVYKKPKQLNSHNIKGYDSLYNIKKKQKISYAEKQIKGQKYEKYISQYFKDKGWITYEHGLIKKRNDAGIDLILKKDREFLFVQCKNWNSNHKYKMGIKKIQEYRKRTKEFMKNNPKISRTILNLNYKIKLVFISTEDIYTKEAKKYIEENKDVLEYKIIPMKDDFEDF